MIGGQMNGKKTVMVEGIGMAGADLEAVLCHGSL